MQPERTQPDGKAASELLAFSSYASAGPVRASAASLAASQVDKAFVVRLPEHPDQLGQFKQYMQAAPTLASESVPVVGCVVLLVWAASAPEHPPDAGCCCDHNPRWRCWQL
jgi:hypothetical protein